MLALRSHTYVAGPTAHFQGRCLECDAHYLVSRTLADVEDMYHQGRVSQDEYEAYVHVWATSAVRGERWDSWLEEPWIPEVSAFAVRLREIHAEKVSK